ncbi:CPBP family intramembrane glutamic endopeptidase [candidate division KSB1 bacterium]
MDETRNISPISLKTSIILFGIPALLLHLLTKYGIPLTDRYFGFIPVISWFFNGGIVFIGLFAASIYFVKKEIPDSGIKDICSRLRLKSISKSDIKWTLKAFLFVGVSSGICMGIWILIVNKTGLLSIPDLNPPFLEMEQLHTYPKWFFIPWAPFFFFNIFGEELFWRGYILRGQEMTFGKYAWLVNGALWAVFHISFGLQIIISIFPLLFILPYSVQKTKNIWVGILLHGFINGSVFLAKSFGLF